MSERKFTYPEWGYTLEKFKSLASKKKYAIRFRLEYFYLLTDKTSLKQLVFIWVQNAGAIFKMTFVLARFQIFRKPIIPKPGAIVILLARNNVYLQTLKPVILYFAKKKSNILILCPEKHFEFIKGKLGPDAEPYLFKIESIGYEPNWFKRALKLIIALLVFILDGIWFLFQPVKKTFWLAPVFSRYGFTQSFFGKGIEKYFKSGAKLISANDHWMWESLYFTSARHAKAPCYVFQHGVTGDITFPIFADQFLAWGKFDSEKMQIECGAKPNEVRIIGSPHFDDVYQKINLNKTADTQFHKPYITFLSQPFFNSNFMEPGYYQQIMDRFCALAPLAEKFGKKLVIKLHPADKAEYYSGIDPNVEISTEPLLDNLDNTCMAFTVDSTSIFEAVMYGIPVMQCGVKGTIRTCDFSSTGICKYGYSTEEMEDFTEDIFKNLSQYDLQVATANQALELYFFDYKNQGTVERVGKLLG